MHMPLKDGSRKRNIPAHIQEAHFDAEATGTVLISVFYH